MHNPKIKLLQFLINRFYIRTGCFGQDQTYRTQNGRVFHILHAAKVCITVFHQQNSKYRYFLYIRYNNVRIILKIWVSTYFCVANRLPPSPCLNFYSFMSFYAYKAITGTSCIVGLHGHYKQ